MSNLKTLRILSISVFSLLICLFAGVPEYALAANPNAVKDSDTMTSATLVCGAGYWVNQSLQSTGHENLTAWTIRNINDDHSLYIDRIRVYEYDGSLFRDYRWTGAGFHDVLGSGTTIPADRYGHISGTDNELGPMQPFQYIHQALYEAGVIPEHIRGEPNQITLVIDWHADKSVYPMSGGVTRHRGEVFMMPGVDEFDAYLGRSSHECEVINKVYK